MRSASNVSASKNRIALNTKEQCDLLESHGVEFKLCSKAEAESFLRNNTYFFKIKAFDKNFGLRVKMCVWLGVSRGLDLAFLNAD